MSERVPKGYQFDRKHLIHVESGHWSVLNDTTFKEIDEKFRGLPTLLLSQSVTRTRGRVVVVDVGGGLRSQAAKDIQEKFRPKVLMVNIDPIAQPRDGVYGIYPIPSTVDPLPIRSDAADLVLSNMLLTNLPGNTEQVVQLAAITDMVRATRPGGVCLIDFDGLSRYLAKDPDAQALATSLGAKISIKSTNEAENLVHDRFLVIQKYPLDHWANLIINEVPQEYAPPKPGRIKQMLSKYGINP